jgi:hypothetical protein
MNPLVQNPNLKPGRFRVGELVRIAIGFSGLARAEILEDHGPLGVGGRRYYTVRLMVEGGDDMLVDWPEDELEPLDAKPTRANGES